MGEGEGGGGRWSLVLENIRIYSMKLKVRAFGNPNNVHWHNTMVRVCVVCMSCPFICFAFAYARCPYEIAKCMRCLRPFCCLTFCRVGLERAFGRVIVVCCRAVCRMRDRCKYISIKLWSDERHWRNMMADGWYTHAGTTSHQAKGVQISTVLSVWFVRELQAARHCAQIWFSKYVTNDEAMKPMV